MSTPPAVDVYRNLTRRAWSVRRAGRVFAHVQALCLAGVTLRASEASRLRCVSRGIRDVHAWAQGTPSDLARPPEAIRVRYRPHIEAGFRGPEGELVTEADACWAEEDGSFWCLAARSGSIRDGGPHMSTLTRYGSQEFDLADLASRPVIEDWELVPEPRGDGMVLRGVDEQGNARETGTVQGLNAEAGWAWAWGSKLIRLGSPLSCEPTAGITL